MTDANSTSPNDLNINALLAKHREHARLSESLRPANKAALFDPLARAGITIVTVSFNGSCDDGQVEEIQAMVGDAPVDLPDVDIELLQAVSGRAEPRRSTLNIREAIETVAYDFLEETHGGWENNDGAYGEFTFLVTEGTITLDHNARFTDSEHSFHEF
jgi:hypothetical protein